MSDQPVATVEPPAVAPTAPSGRLRVAGIVVVVAAAVGVALVLGILSVRVFEPMFLYALCPWLFVLMLVHYAYALLVIPSIFGLGLAVLGVQVIRGSRDALVAAITMLVVEAIPSVLIVVASGASFVIPAVPRVAVIIFLATVLRATKPVAATTPAVAAPSSLPPAASRSMARVIVGWAFAVAGGVSLGLAYRAARSLAELTYYERLDQFDWWLPMSWPAAILAFALGWFAGTTRTAILRAVLALVLYALFSDTQFVLDSYLVTTVATSILLAVVMGWLGHVARRRTLPNLLAALSLPALMAYELVRRPGGFLPSVGAWSVLWASALLAGFFVVRWMMGRLRARRPHRSDSDPPTL